MHPKYQSFLKEQTHLQPRTLELLSNLIGRFPQRPRDLGASWLRSRMGAVSPHTLKKERTVMKHLMRFLGMDTTEVSRLKLPRLTETVTVEDLYTREEIESILKACHTTRDRALYQVLYESGVRASELLSMTVERVTLNQDGTATITVNGKTGTRSVPVFNSVPALKSWMDVHPFKKGSLWVVLRRPHAPLTYHGLFTVTSRIFVEAGLKSTSRKILHMFRHTRATELVRLGVRGQTLSKFMGWTPRSNMEAVYVHLSTEDVETAVRSQVFGLESTVSQPEPLLRSARCPRCGTANDPAAYACSQCSMPLSNEALVAAVAREQETARMQSELESMRAELERIDEVLTKYDRHKDESTVKVLTVPAKAQKAR